MIDVAPERPRVDALNGLLRQVGDVVRSAEARVAATPGSDLAAGAAEVEVIAACERIARMVAAVQLDAISALEARRRVTHPPADPLDAVAVERAERAAERSVRAEVSMARGVSTGTARRSHELARALNDLPRTRSLLARGVIDTEVARAVSREADSLPVDQRRRLDGALGDYLPEMTLRQAGAEARRLAIAFDPDGADERARRAREQRSVGLRRDADAMATLRVYGPAEEIVASWRRLTRQALSTQASGAADGRTHRQLTCDLALHALRHGALGFGDAGGAVDDAGAGATTPSAGTPDGAALAAIPRRTTPSAEIGLLMRPEVLFGEEDTPAVLEGYGPIPAPLARRLATEAAAGDRAWIRRLFTTPSGDRLVSVDSRRRRFPAPVARLIRAADDTCLRPACDCGVRDLDHVHAHARGGASTADNGQGLCQSDDLLKEMRGWRVHATTDTESGTVDTVTWLTPTGHSYSARRSRPGGGRAPGRIVPRPATHSPDSVMETRLRHLVGRLRQ